MKKESKQDEATVEQPEVASKETTEVTPEVTSTETKETSEKPRTEAEFRKLQSIMTKAINEAKAKDQTLQSVQNELQELRKFNEQQRSEARRKEIADLEGEPDEQAKVRRKHQLEDEVTKLQELKTKQEGAVQRKYDQAINLAQQYNLNLDDARELMAAETPKEMELLAQLKVAERAKGVKLSQESSSFTPDSGTSDVGQKRTWTEQEISDMSVEEYRKNKDEIEKAQREGRIK